ncbi:GyrI-like domain-containing protein [Paenibacillus spongiae]|uniref:GyrI-like domain-containing protein n=1 Tax=Paenibacillus spongiae TaxID=2909671 RepID=UPI0035A25EDC
MFGERFDVLLVEASAWAVFTTIEKRANETQDTWARIYSEWFPTSGYEMTDGPEILWYESYDFSK